MQFLFCKCFWQPSAAFQPPPSIFSSRTAQAAITLYSFWRRDLHCNSSQPVPEFNEKMLFFNYLWYFSQKEHQNRKRRQIKKLLLCFSEPSHSSTEDGLRPQSPLPVPRCCEAQGGKKTNKQCRHKFIIWYQSKKKTSQTLQVKTTHPLPPLRPAVDTPTRLSPVTLPLLGINAFSG